MKAFITSIVFLLITPFLTPAGGKQTEVPFELNLSCEKKVYQINTPIPCTATLKAKKDIHVNKRFMWGAEFVTEVHQNEKELPFNCVHATVQPSEKDMVLLKKNEVLNHEFNLADCYEFQKGIYKIEASYRTNIVAYGFKKTYWKGREFPHTEKPLTIQVTD